MGFYNKYPYTDFHELNLDWFLDKFKGLVTDWEAFRADMLAKYEELRRDMNALMEYMYEHFQEAVEEVFNHLIETGEFDIIIRRALGKDVVDVSYYEPFAQILPELTRTFGNHYYEQGFCIGEYNGNPVMMNCFPHYVVSGGVEVPDEANNEVVFTRFDEGNETEITRFNLPGSGHMNSACYNPDNGKWYVATTGGNQNSSLVFEINGTLDGTYTTYSLVNINGVSVYPWAITYSQGLFYVLVSGGYMNIYKDLSLTPEKQITYDTIPDVVYQGILADDHYLYLPCGNTSLLAQDPYNVNFIDVLYKDGKRYKTIRVEMPLEMEEIALYNDVCYVACNSQSAGLIATLDLYKFNAFNHYKIEQLPNLIDVSRNVYIDETYTGFYMNGEENTPLSSLAWWYLFVPNNTTYLHIILKSDSIHALTITAENIREVSLEGYNDTLKRVHYVFVKTMQFVMRYILVTGNENYASIPAGDRVGSVYSMAQRTYITRCQFGETSNPDTIWRLFEIYGRCEITYCTVNSVIDQRMFMVFGALTMQNMTWNQMSWGTGNQILGNMILDGTFRLAAAISAFNENSGRIGFYNAAASMNNIDINAFRGNFSITLGTGITLVNAPTGFDTGVIAIETVGVSASRTIVRLYKADSSTATVMVN